MNARIDLMIAANAVVLTGVLRPDHPEARTVERPWRRRSERGPLA